MELRGKILFRIAADTYKAFPKRSTVNGQPSDLFEFPNNITDFIPLVYTETPASRYYRIPVGQTFTFNLIAQETVGGNAAFVVESIPVNL